MDVLCIDDDELDLRILEHALRRALPRLSIGAACSEGAALAALAAPAPPRAALLDWKLLGGDSLDLLRRIRADHDADALAIVIISGASPDTPDAASYRALGIVGWIEKGSVGAMAAALRDVLGTLFET